MRALLRDLVFTPSCICCAALGEVVCPTCLTNLSTVKNSRISQIDLLICASDYSNWIRDRVIQFKSGNYQLGRALAQVVVEKCLVEIGNFPVVPIPTSVEKLRLRKIDTIGHLAKQIKLLDPKVSVHSNLVLVRSVRDQVGLNRLERQQNVAGAFASLAKFQGPVVLLDDVVTTGATISAAANALKVAGATEVFAVGLCAASHLG